MTDLLELASRVEAAERGGRDLSVAVAMAVGWKTHPVASRHSLIRPDGHETRQPPPDFTSSLDAAMSLVPEGCLAMVKELWDNGTETKAALCRVARYGNTMWTGDFSGLAATPALALTAACLRAKEAA